MNIKGSSHFRAAFFITVDQISSFLVVPTITSWRGIFIFELMLWVVRSTGCKRGICQFKSVFERYWYRWQDDYLFSNCLILFV